MKNIPQQNLIILKCTVFLFPLRTFNTKLIISTIDTMSERKYSYAMRKIRLLQTGLS